MKESRWIRLETNIPFCSWLRPLSSGARWCWTCLLCHTKAYGYAGRTKALAPGVFASMYAVSESEVNEMLTAARADGTLEVDAVGDWRLVNWAQYQVDTRIGVTRGRNANTVNPRKTLLQVQEQLQEQLQEHNSERVAAGAAPPSNKFLDQVPAPKKKNTAAPKEKKKRAHSLPDSWQPNAGHAEKARSLGVDLTAEVEKFRNHWEANGALKVSWDATFRNWLIRAKELNGLYGARNGKHDKLHRTTAKQDYSAAHDIDEDAPIVWKR
jgi:hypothetical protein